MTSITFKLPQELKASLEEEAEKDGRSVSDFLRRHFQVRLNPNCRKPTTPRKGARK